MKFALTKFSCITLQNTANSVIWSAQMTLCVMTLRNFFSFFGTNVISDGPTKGLPICQFSSIQWMTSGYQVGVVQELGQCACQDGLHCGAVLGLQDGDQRRDSLPQHANQVTEHCAVVWCVHTCVVKVANMSYTINNI